MRARIAVLVSFVVAVVFVYACAEAAPPKVPHIARASAPGATTSQSFSVVVQTAVINADGSAMFSLKYTNGNSQNVVNRTLYVDAAGVSVLDDRQAAIATPAPAALVSAIANFNTIVGSLVTTAAASGKLNL